MDNNKGSNSQGSSSSREMVMEDEEGEEARRGNGAMMYVRVMTDEQMEVLRRQISVYATICEQLVEMHKALTAHRDPLTGMRLGGLYCDSLLMSGGHKITGRQRWSPTIGQLQILERIFEQDNGAPSKKKIKDITSELGQLGKISETNVYNWFQNRRARSKRKQSAASSNTESEVEAEVESPDEKRARAGEIRSHGNQPHGIEENSSQNREVISGVHVKEPEPIRMQSRHPSNGSSNYSGSPDQTSSYENTPNPSMDQPHDGADGLSWGPYCVWAG